MTQFGTLSAGQQTTFISYQESNTRQPSFVVFISSFGDVSTYVQSLDCDRNIESLKGRGNIAIGVATLVLNNESGYFYSSGKSNIPSNTKIKIWAGFGKLNIPVFTGITFSIKPKDDKSVYLVCYDYMGLFYGNFIESTLTHKTPKTILDYFCSLYDLQSDVPTTSETALTYYSPRWTGLRMLTVVEKVCDSLFSIAYFDEDGHLQFVEREHKNYVDYVLDDDNVSELYKLQDSEIINDVRVSYLPAVYSCNRDQLSIDTYGIKSREISIPSFASGSVSSYIQGTGDQAITNSLEGFKFTSASDAVYIDTVHLKLKTLNGVGYVYVKIYSDNAGVPDTLLATSLAKPVNDLSVDYVLEIFNFNSSLKINPSTNYWCIIDIALLSSGTVNWQTWTYGNTAIYAYNDGTWHTQTNKYPIHNIKGSLYAKQVAEDVIEYYKNPYERIRIHCPAIPQLQLFDELMVDSERMEIEGRYIICGIRQMMNPDGFKNILTLRKTSLSNTPA